MSKVLVTGATGTVGREVVRALLERGASVRALVRSEQSARKLPAGVEAALGDLGDRAAVEKALSGVDAAFYLSPHEPNELALGESFLALCEARKTRLVFFGVHLDGPNAFVRWLLRALVGMKMPHYAPKFALAEKVRRSPKTQTLVVAATNFFQNDDLCRDALLAGSFPAAILGHKPLNRVDVRDIGDGVARLLVDTTLPPGGYPIIGPASLTGPDCAAAWGKALGREVRYTGDDLAAWNTYLADRLAGKKLTDIVDTSAGLREIALPTRPKDLARCTELLGRPPRDFESYTRDMASLWRQSSVAKSHGG